MILSNRELTELFRNPHKSIESSICGNRFVAKIGIPDYADNVSRHYSDILNDNLNQFCQATAIPFDFVHFGLVCEFEKAFEIPAYSETRILHDNLKEIIRRLGVAVLKNVYLSERERTQGHRARFKQLNFHRDRGSHQPEHYSLYFRDPFDEVQKYPRTSSTLFIANIVAYLQLMKEKRLKPDEKMIRNHYEIFTKNSIECLTEDIVLEHTWTAPEGTGEISCLDNHAALHASYYRTAEKGYPIGVRYLK